MESKKITQSKTVWFGIAVLSGGGLDLVNQWIQSGETDWRSIALMVTGLVAIGLRVITSKAVEL